MTLKKLGDLYTVRGIMPVNVGNRKIQLFDGRFDTGYRVESIRIMASLPLLTHEFHFILSTDELVDAVTIDFAQNTQIGWAVWNTPSGYIGQHEHWVDPDNLVVEDLFISNRGSSDGSFINYMITMQKYDISEWQGALAMVRNRGQGAPVNL